MTHKEFIHFPDTVIVTPLMDNDGRRRMLLNDIRYFMAPGVEPIVVSRGFVTDYASVPRIFWPLIPSWGPYGPAAIVHDWLYHNGPKLRVPDPDNPGRVVACDRKTADRIFLLAMEQLGVGWLKRTVMYWVVRLCGFRVYKNKRKMEESDHGDFRNQHRGDRAGPGRLRLAAARQGEKGGPWAGRR